MKMFNSRLPFCKIPRMLIYVRITLPDIIRWVHSYLYIYYSLYHSNCSNIIVLKILINGKAFKILAWYYMFANVFTTTSLCQKILIPGKAFKILALYYISSNVFTTIFEIYMCVLVLNLTDDTHFTTCISTCRILYFVLNDYVNVQT